MKIIYSIINYEGSSSPGGFLEFKLHLSKKDWILIKQFPKKTMKFTFNLEDKDLIKDTNISFKANGMTNGGMQQFESEIKNEFSEIKEKDKEEYWESSIYRIELLTCKPPLKDLLFSIAEQLQFQLKDMSSKVPETDPSCWNEEQEIQYK